MTQKIVSFKDVQEHKSRDSVWFVIHNKVYDVSKFLEDHPGGEEVLLEQAGCNATEIFEDVNHSADAKELLKTFFVGDLHEDDKFPDYHDKKEKKVKTNFDGSDRILSISWTQWTITIGVSAAVTLLVKYFFIN